LLGLDEHSSAFAQNYINIAAIGILFNGLADANKRLLNCFGFQTAPMVISLVLAVFHLCSCYLFCFHLGLNIYGPAVAQVLSNLLYLVMITSYSLRLNDPSLKKAL
jgi:Na+-driven multidrug efflux pump